MTRTFATPMPTKRPAIKHAHTPWVGDSPASIHALPRDGMGDFNFRWFWQSPPSHGDAVNVHWPDPRRNNFRWIVGHNGKPRRLKFRELRRKTWTLSEVLAWRRPVYGKRRRGRRPIVGWEQPHTYGEMVRSARLQGRVIVAELKSNDFASWAVAEQMVETAKAADHPAWFMALYGSLPNCEGKCHAIRHAGGDFAVIFGRASLQRRWRPAFGRDVHTWTVKPSAVW